MSEPSTTTAQTIADLLQTIPDPEPTQTAESYLTQLSETGRQSQVQANAYRIKLGLALLATKPTARKGVTAWETENAKRLGVDARQVRTYCATAKTVNGMAAEMAAEVLDRPLQKVVAEARRLQAGLPSDKAPRKPREPYREAVGAAVRLLQQVAPEEQLAWLDAFRTAIEIALAETQGKNAPMD